MSLNVTNLSVLAYANSFTLWHYTTIDQSVTDVGYFNSAADMLRANDLIIANFNTAATPETKFYIVTSAANGVVAVAAYA